MFYGIYAQIMAKKIWICNTLRDILETFVRNGIDVKIQR
jgi:hypothetical protein